MSNLTALTESTRLQLAIDKVIVTVPFDQKCPCARCMAMQELQQAALAEMRLTLTAPTKVATHD